MISVPLMEDWLFTWRGEEGPEEAPEKITLPHTFARDGKPRRGRGRYERRVEIPAGTQAAYLSFEGADQCCRVLVDGEEAGRHEGGYSRFRIPVPEGALARGGFRLTVELDNRVNEQVSPHFGDFTVYGGLYRPVSLLLCEETRFDYAWYGTDGLLIRTEVGEDGRACLRAECHTAGPEGAELRMTLLDPEGRPVAQGMGPEAQPPEIRLTEPVLWNGTASPACYTLRAELIREGRTADSQRITVGFRRVTADGNGLRLNGVPCFLRGAAKHQDRAGALTAGTDREIAEDFDILQEMGANAVRLSHYQHPQAAYEECDRRGLLAWAEIPMLKMTEDPALQANARQQLTELILQNLHHPSIFCWGIQNEIAMFRDAPFMHEACRELHALARRLDPGRMTACANLYPVPPRSELNGITDLVGYNYYFGWYYGEWPGYGEALDAFHRERPDTPVGITEYGADGNPALHSAEPKVKDYSEEYQALFHERVYPFLRSRPWLWGSFIWNLFDFSSDRRKEGGLPGLNGKGLVTWDRKVRKDAFYYYQAQWSDAPVLHLCGWRYRIRAAEKMDVKVYTNLPEVTLEANGAVLGTARTDDNSTAFFSGVPLRPGENRIAVRGGGLREEAVFLRSEAEPESYRLPEEAGSSVTNWFLQQEVRKDRFSILNTAQQILEHPSCAGLLRESFPALYTLLTEKNVVPLGLTMKSILERDIGDDPDRIGRFQQALQEIPLA